MYRFINLFIYSFITYTVFEEPLGNVYRHCWS